MVAGNGPVNAAVMQYFNATGRLLREVLDSGGEGEVESSAFSGVEMAVRRLKELNDDVDYVRLAYIELSRDIEAQINRLHFDGLYPDLFRGSTSEFKLMDDILYVHKKVLLMEGSGLPEIRLTGSTIVWRDKGLLDFATDQQVYLRSIKFTNFWDAVQCHETQRYMLARLFECLSETGNLPLRVV